MATVDLLLPSSPPGFSGCQVAAMSSSPIFPSPSALVRKRPQLKSSSRAAPIPAFATISFTTAAHLLTERHSKEAAAATDDPFTNKSAKTKASRKPKADEKLIEGDEPVVKKPRKPRAKKVDVDAETTPAPVEKPPRKSRAKKDAPESQPKLPKGRVTKASSGSRAEKAASKRKTEVVSSYFGPAATDSTDPFVASNLSENGLLLQEAVKRRRNWTPPKPGRDSSDTAKPETQENRTTSRVSDSSGEKQKTITGLLGQFGYINGDGESASDRIPDQRGAKKRKLIELVGTNNTATTPPVTKAKAPKKKPRTITELATSAYAVDVNEGKLDSLPPPLLRHFSYLETPSEETIEETIDGFKVPPKPRRKSPTKTSAKASKAKKGTAQAPILLSPESALKQVQKQEFVFGTSSQLAREDSPTLLRDLHQAMRASNEVEIDELANDIEDMSPSESASAFERGTELYTAKRNLWAAASRSVEGALMDIETIDMSESPQFQLPLKPSVTKSGQFETASDAAKLPIDDVWHDLDSDNSPVKVGSREDELTSSKVGPVEAAIRLEILSSPARGKETIKPSSLKANASGSRSAAKADDLSEQRSGPQKPDYGSYPTARLAKEIASYRIKPLKGRDNMISLLERCWEGKQMVAANNKEKAPEAGISPSAKNKPLVLRQTPKKQKKANPIPEEIYDSDTPITPSPPRRRIKVRTPPPLPLQPSTSTSLDPDSSANPPALLSPTSQRARLHKHITRAVTAAPPSADPAKPSWHEKMLLYDPIVLEDLAAWLNTSGALERAGWDGEVEALEVKRWCLEKSVCCLWRENLRGAARSRY